MKLFNFKILLLFFALFVISCDNEADELVKYYKSQNHSQELKGWWRQINYEQDTADNPHKVLFEDLKMGFYSFQIYDGQYSGNEWYWYNDDEKIYLLTPGDFKIRSDEEVYYYQLNITNDTLKIYMENPPYIYVRDTGL